MGSRARYGNWERVFQQLLAFSREVLRRSDVRLDREEFEGLAGLACWEALRTYPAYEGCCSWESYCEVRLQEMIREMCHQRSRRLRVESDFSLDQPWGETQRPAAEFIGPPRGDFTNGVAFWDYVDRLEEDKRWLVRCYCNKETDEEILARTDMARNDLIRLKQALRRDMERYLAI